MQITPRKSPRQARAKVTVDAIVEATIQLLLADGYDKFTTVRAAERAGVSVGSLYQYFPNKAALASAVIDRCCEHFLTAFDSAVVDQPTLDDCIHALVDFAFVSHHITPDLHRIVQELAVRLGVEDKADSVSRTATKAIESVLRRHSDEIAPEIDLAVAATIIETMLEALAHRAMLDPERTRHDALVAETTRLIRRYLAISRE
jgi:AcrR family transcriptional regulator